MLFVNPGNPGMGKLNKYAALEPPFWCAYQAAIYRSCGSKASILDCEAEGLDIEETLDRIMAVNEMACIVAMGNNPSVSSTPKMDIVNAIMEKLEDKKAYIIKGLHPVSLDPKATSMNIDIHEIPAWDLLDLNKYRAHNWHCLDRLDKRSPYAVTYTSFGCPYSCGYCNVHALYGGSRRVIFRPPELVVEELEYLHNRGVRNIKFADELFTLNREHVMAICKGIERLGLNIWAYARSDTINPTLLATMKAGGINWLAFGFDDKYTEESAKETKELCGEAGINIIANFMVGLPGDTMEAMVRRMELVKELNFEWLNLYCAFPYPGSLWYNDCVKKGIKLPDNWEDYAQYSPNFMPLDTESLKGKEILQFRDNAWEDYYKRPQYIKMIGNRFGQDAVKYVEGMLEVKLERGSNAKVAD